MWWFLLGVLFVVFYWKWISSQSYWKSKGVPQVPPDYFFMYTIYGFLISRLTILEMIQVLYNTISNGRYHGYYQFGIPSLIVKDPEIIKDITIKSFDHFVDHRTLIPEDVDPLWNKNLFASRGERWREMRTKVSPTFTSSKMKYMFSLLSKSGQQFVDYFRQKQEDVVEVELKDIYTRYANDVIANVVFGVECDSQKNIDNQFFTLGKEATNFTGVKMMLKTIGFSIMPKLFKVLDIKLLSNEFSDFFVNLVKDNIKARETRGIVRPDVINILLEARKHGFEPGDKSSKLEIADEDIVGLAVGFFFAGFETVSTFMSFLAYELGVNQDVQERLRQEIDDVYDTCQGQVTYEALLGMKYLDMVLSETLRKWPSAPAVDRVCTKPFIILPKTPDEKPVHLQEGDVIFLPIFSIQRDPDNFPDPDRFDPERFSDENKGNIKPYTYIPFGSGPRNCIGSRFALLEVKALFFHLLANFEIVPVAKTRIPVQLSRKSFNMVAEGGFWFGLKKRVK